MFDGFKLRFDGLRKNANLRFVCKLFWIISSSCFDVEAIIPRKGGKWKLSLVPIIKLEPHWKKVIMELVIKKNVYNRNVNLYQNENLHIFFQCGALPFINNDICRTKQQVFVSFCIVRAPGRYSKFASYERTN